MIPIDVKRFICVIGTGHVGMATMVGLAELGWVVAGYDVSADRIRRLRAGAVLHRDAVMVEAFRTHAANGRLELFESLEEATREAEVIIITVATPAREDGSGDLSALHEAVDALVALNLTAWPTVVVRSSVPPGTSDRLAKHVERWGELVYAPAFLRECFALDDFLRPDRIVVGSESAGAAVHYVKLFEALGKPLFFTSRSSAELIERASNAFLALKTSFANEIANLCDALSATSDDVLRGIAYDRRIGSQFLNPGLGFGDPRFESDVKTIECLAAEHNVGRELLSATVRVNAAHPHRIVDLVEKSVGSVNGLTVGVWGLAFNSAPDDSRDPRALRIVDMLADRGAKVVAYDPGVHVANLPKGSRLVQSALEAADADVLVVLAEWPEFQALAPHAYAPLIRRGVVVDVRNVLDAERVISAGLTYRGIGRAVASNTAPSFLPSALTVGNIR